MHVTRISCLDAQDPKEKEIILSKMRVDAIKAAKELAYVKPAVIAFCCTSGSFVKGEIHNKEIITNIEKETNIRTITTSTAVLEALKQLNIKKIAMATPYPKEITTKGVKYFEENIPSLKVVSLKCLDLWENFGDLYPESAYIATKEVNVPETEAVFISCTAWRTIEIIDLLEKDLGKPVITSNQATMWAILKNLNIHSVEGYGQLLKKL